MIIKHRLADRKSHRLSQPNLSPTTNPMMTSFTLKQKWVYAIQRARALNSISTAKISERQLCK